MQDLEKAGKYEILSRIGEGGFGVVYMGRDPFIKRAVAIKTCTSENESTRRRFLREAEIAGNLVHPNITVVYDFGFEDSVPYLVQEFLSGEDLDVKIARRDAIPLATKLDYLLQTAQGLGFAHEQGITHRDIKPSNLRVLDDGRVKIMDFGIAKLASGETQLTQTGTTLGTPAYLSPEQLRGDEVDGRSDIYSFGALAYELLTYRRMFDAQTISALFFQILHQEPTPLTQTLEHCPPGLEALVARCVAKNPDQRSPSVIDIVVGLRRVIAELPAEPTSSEGAVEPTREVPAVEHQKAIRDEQERQTAIVSARNQIEDLLASGHYEAAASALDTARGTFGNLVPFRTLEERLVEAKAMQKVDGVEESAELLAAVEGVRQLTHQGLLEEAAQALGEARETFPEGPSLIAAGRQLRVQTKIFEARQALEENRLDSAEQAAQRAQELDPDAPELPQLLQAIDDVVRPASAAAEKAQSSARESKTAVLRVPATASAEAPGEKGTAPVSGSPISRARLSAPTAAPARGAAMTRQARQRGRWLLVAAALVIILALITALALRRGSSVDAEAPRVVTLDASPWAELVSLTDESGAELREAVAGGDRLFTPIALELPPGRYQAVLSGPEEASRTFDLEVATTAEATQRLELKAIDAVDYFRSVGILDSAAEKAP